MRPGIQRLWSQQGFIPFITSCALGLGPDPCVSYDVHFRSHLQVTQFGNVKLLLSIPVPSCSSLCLFLVPSCAHVLLLVPFVFMAPGSFLCSFRIPGSFLFPLSLLLSFLIPGRFLLPLCSWSVLKRRKPMRPLVNALKSIIRAKDLVKE